MIKKFEMYTRRGNPDTVFNQLEEEEILGEGIEGEVRRITLVRIGEDEKRLKGFVKKEYHFDQEQYRDNVEQSFVQATENWEAIIDLVKKQKKENRNAFNIPGTVRPYIDNDGRFGFIITDLSQGGSRHVVSLSELRTKLFENPNFISRDQWNEIKTALYKDLEIAQKERIKLKAGDLGLDAWMITIDPKGEVQLWLADIGQFVKIGADQNLVDRTIKSQRNSIIALDELISGEVSPLNFWKRRGELEE